LLVELVDRHVETLSDPFRHRHTHCVSYHAPALTFAARVRPVGAGPFSSKTLEPFRVLDSRHTHKASTRKPNRRRRRNVQRRAAFERSYKIHGPANTRIAFGPIEAASV